MNKFTLLTLALCLLTGCRSVAPSLPLPRQETVLRFSPATLQGGVRVERTWREDGFEISATGDGERSFMGSASQGGSERPTPAGDYIAANDSDYVKFLTNHTRDGALERVDKGVFTPRSVDLAEYSTVFPRPQPVFFYGIKPDGSVVACAFVTDGIIDGPGGEPDFQTFHFPKEFNDIKKLGWPIMRFSMDNIVIEK